MSELINDSEVLRIASRDSIEPVEGGLAIYKGDLSEQTALRYTRRLQFWPWGRSSGSIASGTLEISNGNGNYDELITLDIRNRAAALRVRVGSQTQPIVTPIIDSTEAVQDRTIRIMLKDALALFDAPLQQETYGDDADEALRGKVLPKLIGVGRSIPGQLWNANHEGGAYRITSGPLSGLGGVFDKAVRLDPTATPPQWEFDTRIGNAGFWLNQATVGRITADASATGDGILPPAPVDLLNGEGNFSTAFDGQTGPNIAGTIAGMPPGWLYRTRNSGIGGTPEGWGVRWRSQLDGYMWFTTGNSGPSNTGWIEAVYIGTGASPFRLQADTTYRWTVRIATDVIGGFPRPPFSPGDTGLLTLYAGPRASSGSTTRDFVPSSRVIREWAAFSPGGQAGVYSGLFRTPPGSAGQEIIFRLVGSGAAAGIDEIEFIAVPEPQDVALPGVTLENYIREIVRLSGQPESLVEWQDLIDIDPDEREIGYWTDEPVQSLSMMRLPLDSYSADVYSSRDGKIRFARLRDPALETPAFVINPDNMRNRPRIWLDPATGLTTTATARRNYHVHSPNELAGSISELPLDQRQQYIQPDRLTVQALMPDNWPEQYRHAIGATPLRTLYDDAATALAELQRIVNLYAVLRWFIEVEIFLDVFELLPEIDQVPQLVYPRYNLQEGRNMIITQVGDVLTGKERRQYAILRLWG